MSNNSTKNNVDDTQLNHTSSENASNKCSQIKTNSKCSNENLNQDGTLGESMQLEKTLSQFPDWKTHLYLAMLTYHK